MVYYEKGGWDNVQGVRQDISEGSSVEGMYS